MVLGRMAKRRQHRIRLGLPDALDLLVVSVEAGLGLDQAIQRVGEELAFAHPDLSRRAAAGQPRAARRQGARRSAAQPRASAPASTTSSSLVAMLVQTDKFGTSVAQSLRVHSETLRTKRRQRAEEAAAKTGVKMVFPLVFCIFPAIWVVTIGPAAIKFVAGPRSDGEQMSHGTAIALDRLSTTTAPVPPAPVDARRHRPRAPIRSTQLLIKTLYTGEATGLALADRMRLPYRDPRAADRAAARRAARSKCAAPPAPGRAGYRYALTDLGRDRARQYLDANQYVGPAPVPLAALRRRHARAAAPRAATSIASACAQGFSHLIIGDERARAARARRSTPARRCSSTARPATARR